MALIFTGHLSGKINLLAVVLLSVRLMDEFKGKKENSGGDQVQMSSSVLGVSISVSVLFH